MASRYHTVNAMTNEAYFVKFGVHGETPRVVRFDMRYAPRGEWVYFAVPYPPGTSWNFSGTYSASSYVRVNSLSEINATAYFYDTTTNLLWIALVSQEHRYLNVYGKQWYDNTVTMTYEC